MFLTHEMFTRRICSFLHLSSWNPSLPICKYHSTLTGPKKRFYKEVSIVGDNGSYELCLDGRKVKTPAGSVLRVKSRFLALAIATEWQAQKKFIQMDQMHLTTLANTCVDNPMNLTSAGLVHNVQEYLMTDTMCFRSTEPDELVRLEQKYWDPITDWFTKCYDVELNITTNVMTAPVPEATRSVIGKDLSSMAFESLVGINFMTENLKSAILSLALIHRRLSVEEAIRLSRLETEYQVSKWGKFESHDVDERQLQSRVAAALLFAYFHMNSMSETKMPVK